MTNERQKQIAYGNDKQETTTAGPSTAFGADAPNCAQDDKQEQTTAKYGDSGCARMTA
jgi:hypothetical protein